jgi:primary-amine oxidase
MEVKLTGHIGASVVMDGQGTDTSPMVAPMISSPIHQHLFCFRLDFNLDGVANTVCETDIEPLSAGPENPLNSGFRAVTKYLTSETEAKREIDPSKSRSWKVINSNVRNRVEQPVGYKLLAQSSPVMFSGDESLPAKRGAFAKHNLWVTPYDADELYADAGPFSNLHSGGAGLPAYTLADRSIEDTDLVVWHTLGVTHVPRPEDWPIMPVEYAGFTLMPVGFFDQNPALDVAPPSKACHD